MYMSVCMFLPATFAWWSHSPDPAQPCCAFAIAHERNLSTDLYGKVQEAIQKKGLFEVRLMEAEVGLLQGMPERLRLAMHEEMYMTGLLALGFWPMWSHSEDQNFFRNLCHHAMTEHAATPAQDAFMPGTDCKEVYVIESGSMSYSAKQKASSQYMDMVRKSVKESDVLCLPCFWADWHHRGRMTADLGTCYYFGISSEKFCNLSANHGGPLWQYLQIFGILLVGAVEVLDERGSLVTDMCFPEEELTPLMLRSERFATVINSHSDVLTATAAGIMSSNMSAFHTASHSSLGKDEGAVQSIRV